MLGANVDEEFRRSFLWGVVVTAVILAVGTVVFFLGQGEGLLEEHVRITTDFRSITGLRRGSPVQLSGVEIGEVDAISFEATSYPCDPLHEDLGRPEEGRRDDCDALLFCAPEGYCAELEPYEPSGEHRPCRSTGDCPASEVCVDREFRTRYPSVFWGGDPGYCGHYETVLNRVRVTLSIEADKLPLIGKDAVAKVASNSVLGDQLVELSRGDGPPVEPGGHIRSAPSLMEDLETFRARVEVALERFDEGISRATDVFTRMNDPRTTARVKDAIFALGENVEDVASGRGKIGYWFGDEAHADARAALDGVLGVSERVRGISAEGRRRLTEADAEIEPAIDHARQQMADLRVRVESWRTDEDKAALLVDPSGERLATLRRSMADFDGTLRDGLEGRGVLGALVGSDDGWEWVIELIGLDARIRTLRAVVRRAYAAYEDR